MVLNQILNSTIAKRNPLKKIDEVLEYVKRISSELEILRSQAEESDRFNRSQLQEVHRVLKSSRDCLPSEIVELQALRRDLVDESASMPVLGGWPLGSSTMVHICRGIESGRISGNILEFGGGASTLWIASTLKKINFRGKFWSVEHDLNFLNKTKKLLAEHELESFVTLIHAPIASMTLNGESRQWYSLQNQKELIDIGLLIVDGPPGTTDNEARLPSLYAVAESLNDASWIYLDDCHRRDEKMTAEKWLQDFPKLTRNAQIGDTQIFQFMNPNDEIQ